MFHLSKHTANLRKTTVVYNSALNTVFLTNKSTGYMILKLLFNFGHVIPSSAPRSLKPVRNTPASHSSCPKRPHTERTSNCASWCFTLHTMSAQMKWRDWIQNAQSEEATEEILSRKSHPPEPEKQASDQILREDDICEASACPHDRQFTTQRSSHGHLHFRLSL